MLIEKNIPCKFSSKIILIINPSNLNTQFYYTILKKSNLLLFFTQQYL